MDSSSKYRLRTCYMPGKVLGSGEPEMKDTEPLLSKAFIHSCLHSLLQQRAPTITKVLREKQKDKRHESKLPENQNLKRANWTPVQLSHFTDGKTEPGEVNNLLVPIFSPARAPTTPLSTVPLWLQDTWHLLLLGVFIIQIPQSPLNLGFQQGARPSCPQRCGGRGAFCPHWGKSGQVGQGKMLRRIQFQPGLNQG